MENTQLPNEEWRDIKGYEGLYQVSNMGRIMSMGIVTNHNLAAGSKKRMPKRLIGTGTSKRYCMAILTKNGVKNYVLVHRVVASEFIDNPLCKPFVNHKNGIKKDNRVENLEWVTQSENMQHALSTGLLTVTNNKKVVRISDGFVFPSVIAVAKCYGLTKQAIYRRMQGNRICKKVPTLKYLEDE